MGVIRLLIALFAVLVMVSPGVASAGDVVARVDGVDVTTGDIDWRMRNDDVLRFQPIDSPRARLEALRQLSVEIAAEHAIRGALTPGNEVTMSVEQDRRKTLLGMYEVARTSDLSLEPGEVDRFIAANPQIFARRKTWHYHEVVVTAGKPEVVWAMRAKAASIGALPSIETAAMGDVFDWSRSSDFATIMLNRWLGSEAIDPELMKVLGQMAETQRRVRTECKNNACSFVVLHEVVDDPVDSRFGRSAVEETLLAQKRARVASALHGGILKQAVIEFRDPAVAKAASGAWHLPAYLKADGSFKTIWIMQISLMLLSLAWGAWYLFTPGSVRGAVGSIRAKGLVKLEERLESWRFLRAAQRGIAVATIALIWCEGVWALAETSFLKFDHDFAAVAGGSFLVVAAVFALWRFAPLARYLACNLRFAATGLLAACGFNALMAWALG